jgi:hypothetical protein
MKMYGNILPTSVFVKHFYINNFHLCDIFINGMFGIRYL